MIKKDKVFSKGFISIAAWIIVSSAYYLNFLLEGDISPERNQSIFQSFLKLCVPFFIGLYLYLKSVDKFSFYHATKLLILTGALIISLYFRVFAGDFEFEPGLIFFLELLAINLSLFLLGGLLKVLNEKQLEKFSDVVLFSGVLVSFFSIYEIFFLSHLFQEYWIRTEGMRSVSSLLNPNNSGVYMGACILLLMLSVKRWILKIPLGMIFFFPFLLSGSRTAWVCLLIVLMIFGINNSFKNRINLFLTILFYMLVLITSVFLDFFASIIDSMGYDLSNRIADNRSSSARLDKYIEFLLNFNVNYFFPDIYNSNILLVSESSYFTYVNYFGVLGFILFFIFFFIFYKISFVKDKKYRPWNFVFIYYLFVGLFESLVTSFPNNQLFMISAGCLIAFRGMKNNRNEI